MDPNQLRPQQWYWVKKNKRIDCSSRVATRTSCRSASRPTAARAGGNVCGQHDPNLLGEPDYRPGRDANADPTSRGMKLPKLAVLTGAVDSSLLVLVFLNWTSRIPFKGGRKAARSSSFLESTGTTIAELLWSRRS